jgi:PHP domain
VRPYYRDVLAGAGPADQREARARSPSSAAEDPGAPTEAHQSPGALHVHSIFSYDGHGELDAIATGAHDAGLEWIGMTDHDSLGARYAGFEGLRQGVHVIVGYEWTPRGGDHALLYGESDVLPETHPTTIPPAELIRIVTESGAMAFAAHPDEGRTAVPRLPPLPWHDWSIRGFTGIELWNYMSEWAERLTRWNALDHAIRPGRRMRGPTARSLAWWDALNRPIAEAEPSRPSAPRFAGGPRLTVGVSGVDAHGEGITLFGRHVTVFPYRRVFRTYTNVLLLDGPLPADAAVARDAVLGAIRAGRLLFADRSRGDPLGSRFEARLADARLPDSPLPDTRVGIGGWARLSPGGAELVATLPVDAELTLLRDGQPVATARGRELRATTTDPGAYRLEAHRRDRPWLFTNPIVLVGHAAGE